MNLTTVSRRHSSADYYKIIPISMVCVLIAVLIACGILMLVSLTKRLHTVAHLLICNTCVSSIFYCLVQGINYIFLIFIPWETSDISCRWRGYFSYMSIAAVVYSYLIQAISRFFISVLYTKYRRLICFKTHQTLILVEWIAVIIIPLPQLLTNDIHYRPFSLCWVPIENMLHVIYTLCAYYVIPTTFIVAIYITIYLRVKRYGNKVFTTTVKTKQNRDLEVLRNILILFGIYICGGLPTLLYIVTGIKLFYPVGIVFLSLTVAVEKTATIVLDREIRNIVKNLLCRCKTPIKINHSNATAKAPNFRRA